MLEYPLYNRKPKGVARVETFREWIENQAKVIGQSELARRLEITPPTIRSYREGRAIPEQFRELRLAEATGEPVERVHELCERARKERADRKGVEWEARVASRRQPARLNPPNPANSGLFRPRPRLPQVPVPAFAGVS